MADIDVYLYKSNEVGSVTTGRLAKLEDKHVFSYHQNTLQALSLTMPIRTESYNYPELHPIFQMNLPEGSLRQAIERAVAKKYGSDDLSLLALLSPNQIGQLRYAISGRPLIDTKLQTPSLEGLLNSEDANLFNQLMLQYATSSGVAGVQPKVLMDLNSNITDKITLPLSSYIVKSWGKQYPELGCNEFACLSLAKLAGLDVAEFHLSNNGKLLVSKRFDLDANNQPLGFEDFCVLQAKTTKQKYDASLESCANTIRQFVSPENQQKNLYDFFKLTLINILIRNGDAHLKNSGIIYDDLKAYKQGILPDTFRQMAPIFDIVSTVPYLPDDTMALSLTGSKRWPKLKVLQQFAKQHCRLNNEKTKLAIDSVTKASYATLPLLKQLAKKHPAFTPISKVISNLIHKGFNLD